MSKGKVVDLNEYKQILGIRTSGDAQGIGRTLRREPACVEVLNGKIIARIENYYETDGAVVFRTHDGGIYKMESSNSDFIGDIEGNWRDLLGTPLLIAEVSPGHPGPDCRLATAKGEVTIRWYGHKVNFVQFVPSDG